jgi:L-alanine-DL-glutamate epimerase-like enolase superfamily enzyme
MRSTDIRVRDLTFDYEDYRYRSPIKFGGMVLDRVTLLNVNMVVEDRLGKTATGFGSMPLGNVWAWPTRALTYDQTLGAMKELAARLRGVYAGAAVTGHPIDITHGLEPGFLGLGRDTTASLGLSEPVPLLVVLVVASAFDAALHDAFGKAHGLNCYKTYGPDFLEHDLGHYLDAEFAGEQLHDYILTEPKPRMPLYHLVGALDPLTDADVKDRLDDGLPNTLGEWIQADGLTHLKVKLNGDDLNWDVERVVRVNAVAEQVQRQRGVTTWYYSLDFNERCENVDYLLEFLRRLKELTPEGYDRVQYVEQPTARDLKANPANRMHDAARLKPVVIDESLVDLESLRLAREMGYTGVAFKACKGQTQTLLLAAAAQKYGMFRCVQDLSCPGASLIHSAGIAAHVPGVAAIEANSRQYCPAANAAWAPRFPGVFTTRDGTMNTGILTGPGLGAV